MTEDWRIAFAAISHDFDRRCGPTCSFILLGSIAVAVTNQRTYYVTNWRRDASSYPVSELHTAINLCALLRDEHGYTEALGLF